MGTGASICPDRFDVEDAAVPDAAHPSSARPSDKHARADSRASETSDYSYRPTRLARDLIEDEAMAPTGQVELPRGVSISPFSSSSPSSRSRPPTLPSQQQALVNGRLSFRVAPPDAEALAQAEALGEELKKEANKLYADGQLEAAELVYTEAIKVSAGTSR